MSIIFPDETYAIRGHGRLNKKTLPNASVVQCESCGKFGWLDRDGLFAGMVNVSDLYMGTKHEDTEVLCTDCKHETELNIICETRS